MPISKLCTHNFIISNLNYMLFPGLLMPKLCTHNFTMGNPKLCLQSSRISNSGMGNLEFLREIPFYFVTNGFQKETVKSNARAVRAMIISPGLSRCSNNSVAKPLFSSIANYIMRSFGIRRNKKIVCCAMWR
ncbi:hypothetical protein JHK82_024068 [Glycine max]|nr:hypothetical protein JHK85_024629 [Glycine max]KAG5011884.1 hypothetical protein JHK86_024145 [Glycine max]KAG5132880.1 hypothetical protein JHK82_024068 [Glycine max]KAH1041554.1 hypothetical protein GYH30_024088 [Glycine max]